MAESMEKNFGRIFCNYIRPTQKGDKINLPVLCGSPSVFVNVILTRGMTIDLISALQENIAKLEEKGG